MRSNKTSAVFAFGRDDEVLAFRSLEEAAGWMEAGDVIDGEYNALYTLDGQIVTATVADEEVALTVKDENAEQVLRQRLARYWEQLGHGNLPDNLADVANELMQRQWESRWPRRPHWLARLFGNDQPPPRVQ